jgi:hypothetical protein
VNAIRNLLKTLGLDFIFGIEGCGEKTLNATTAHVSVYIYLQEIEERIVVQAWSSYEGGTAYVA